MPVWYILVFRDLKITIYRHYSRIETVIHFMELSSTIPPYPKNKF
jgi:hypothetical protein